MVSRRSGSCPGRFVRAARGDRHRGEGEARHQRSQRRSIPPNGGARAQGGIAQDSDPPGSVKVHGGGGATSTQLGASDALSSDPIRTAFGTTLDRHPRGHSSGHSSEIGQAPRSAATRLDRHRWGATGCRRIMDRHGAHQIGQALLGGYRLSPHRGQAWWQQRLMRRTRPNAVFGVERGVALSPVAPAPVGRRAVDLLR